MLRLLKLPFTVLTFFGLISVVFADLDSGLVGYWSFDEGTGDTAYDYSGNGHHAQLKGLEWTSGMVGNALDYDGNDDSATTETSTDFDLSGYGKEISIAAWIRTEGAVPEDSAQVIICRSQGGIGTAFEYGFYIHRQNKKLTFHISPVPAATYNSDDTMPNNTWLHVAVTHVFGDANSTRLYVNGALISGSWDGNGSKYNTNHINLPVTIGYSLNPQFPSWFNGQIDEVRLYNRALSGSEILELACTNRIYVDSAATGNNNGISWADAYTNLKIALDSAPEQTIICVSKGTYFPTSNIDRTISFQMKEGTILYGGFNTSTGDTTLLTRDWGNNPTILSGDIGTKGDSTDNSYHVVKGANDAILDGFTIKFGNAPMDNGSANSIGGGMLNDSVSPIISNCIFKRNFARHSGGAISNEYSSNVRIVNCRFDSNTTFTGGGAIRNNSSVIFIDKCTFFANKGYYYYPYPADGGAIYNAGTNCIISNCIFLYNRGTYGGAIYSTIQCNIIITNCTFYKNEACANDGGIVSWTCGGAIANWSTTTTIIQNTILWADTGYQSGEIYTRPNQNSLVKLQNCNIDGGINGGKVNSPIVDLGGNINSDPLFNNPDSLDLSLNSSSPCIDSGDNSLVQTEKDINGNARIIDGDNDQTATVDMGAYEYKP